MALMLCCQSLEARGLREVKRKSNVVRIDSSRTVPADTSTVSKGKLPAHISIYKNEKMTGASFIYANLNSSNSELFLLANSLTAQGQFYRIAPNFSWAYHNNCSIGARIAYTRLLGEVSAGNVSLLSDDLKLDLKDVNIDYSIIKAALFHRNYIGLDRRGTVGLFLECQLSYSYNHSTFGKDINAFSAGHSFDFIVSPGIVLFILPVVSVEASLGIIDLGYTKSQTYKANEPVGSHQKWNAAVDLNVLNLNFGITYHF